MLERRIVTIDKLIDVELQDIANIDGTKALVNRKVSLKRLSVLHGCLNTLMEKAIANKPRVAHFDALCETYLILLTKLTQIKHIDRVTI